MNENSIGTLDDTEADSIICCDASGGNGTSTVGIAYTISQVNGRIPVLEGKITFQDLTTSEAEFKSVITALEEAQKINAQKPIIKVDFQGIIDAIENQSTNEYHKELCTQLNRFDDWKIICVPRAKLSYVNKLAQSV